MQIPGLILRKLYTYGSLTQEPDGLCFSLKNRLSDATFLGLAAVHVNGVSVPLDDLTVELGSSGAVPAEAVSRASPRPFPLREVERVRARGVRLEPGTHDLRIEVDTEPFGRLDVRVQDAVQAPAPKEPTPEVACEVLDAAPATPPVVEFDFWTKAFDGNSPVGSPRTYWHWVFPFTQWTWGQWTNERGSLEVTMTGTGSENTNLGSGAFNDLPGAGIQGVVGVFLADDIPASDESPYNGQGLSCGFIDLPASAS